MVDMFRSKKTVKYQDITQSNADGSYCIYTDCSSVCFLHMGKVNSVVNNVLIPLWRISYRNTKDYLNY